MSDARRTVIVGLLIVSQIGAMLAVGWHAIMWQYHFYVALPLLYSEAAPFDRAADHSRQAYEHALALTPPDGRLAESLTAMGIVCWRRKQFREAEDFLHSALVLAERLDGPRTDMVGNIYFALAALFEEQQRWQEATVVCERALPGLDSKPRLNPQLLNAKTDLASLYNRAGRSAEARRLAEEVGQDLPALSGPDANRLRACLQQLNGH